MRAVDPNESMAPLDDEVGDAEAPFKSLTREEAEALRAKHPPLSLWRVVASQAAGGLVVAVLGWFITGRQEIVWSALYGAASVVLPSALMVRGMNRLRLVNAGAAAFNFMFWEFMKIALTVAMLAAAVKVVPDLSWLAMLVALIVCMKMNWLALLWRGRK